MAGFAFADETDDAPACPRSHAFDPPAATPHGLGMRLFGQDFATGAADGIVAAAFALPPLRPRLIVTANVDHIVLLSENAAFRQAYAGAAMRTLDGMPLVWLARRRRHRPVARVTGHDLLHAVLSAPPAVADRVFLVCADARGAAAARARFVASGVPAEGVATAVPPFGFEHDHAYGAALAERVRTHGTTLLVMGVGAPKSEIWVDRQGLALGAPVVLSVGEALNVAAGLVPRAPVLMQRMGLEWSFRFLFAPRRLFRRYFLRSWRFVLIAARERGR